MFYSRKYIMLPFFKKNVRGRTLRKIFAIKSFGVVTFGQLGGWIEKEENLSHKGNCWVADQAHVYDYAQISGNAFVIDKAQVYDYAQVSGNALVQNDAIIRGDASIQDNACITGNAIISGSVVIKDNASITGSCYILHNAVVSGDSCVGDYAHVSDNARISDAAIVCGNTLIYGNAHIRENAEVSNNAYVFGNAVVAESMHIKFSQVTKDLTNNQNLLMSIKAQTNLEVIDGWVYGYKHVRENLTSLHDKNFQYVVGETAIPVTCNNDSTSSCVEGLHFSHASHWENMRGEKVLFVKCKLEDIVAVQQGKIRCKELFVIGVCESEVF